MLTTLITNANIVNEGKVFEGDVLIRGKYIEKIGRDLASQAADRVIDAGGDYLMPGAIDDQVHFREPGLTHKATIYTESRAAVAGGVTSFMEMPNTVPPVFTQKLLQDKFDIAAHDALANHSFFMGTSNDNLEELMKTDLTQVCGLKIFMGSSTGNLLVDSPAALEAIFSRFPGLIATHCEDEATILSNTAAYRERYGENMPVRYHPLVRNAEACYKSSSFAVELARQHGTRLHILHISTARETELFSNDIPLAQKKITAEACIHHLWFNDSDYERLGTNIKWNPAVKTVADQRAVLEAVRDGRIDVIATDHAPHTREEKANAYFKAPSGGPLVQHSMVAMMAFVDQGKFNVADVARLMSHHPAILFGIEKRGYIREGYFADLALITPNQPWVVTGENILAKCGWSPFEGVEFRWKVLKTFVSGHLAWSDGAFDNSQPGMRLTFSRS